MATRTDPQDFTESKPGAGPLDDTVWDGATGLTFTRPNANGFQRVVGGGPASVPTPSGGVVALRADGTEVRGPDGYFYAWNSIYNQYMRMAAAPVGDSIRPTARQPEKKLRGERKLLGRAGASLGLFVVMLIALAVEIALLVFGYWLSDLVYDAGLWPIGALMRIALIFGFLGVLYQALLTVVVPFFALFIKDK